MTEKLKKSALKQDTSRTKFIFVWVGGTLFGWFMGMVFGLIFIVAFSLLIEGNMFPESARSIAVYVMFMLASAGIGIAQQSALRDHLNIHIRGWWWLTALMWSVGAYIAIQFSGMLSGSMAMLPMWTSSIFYAIVLGIPGIVQTLLLRRHVSQAWLYGFATVIGGIIWGALLDQDRGELWLVAPAISAVVTAIVLLWLTSAMTARLSMTKEKSKSM